MRRAIDMGLAALSLIVLLPVMLIAVVGIWISDPGPALFRAVRFGGSGRPFTMHKTRTMRPSDGPRITAGLDGLSFGWGRLVRATKIDELPPLIDILRGRTANFGPRPQDPAIATAVTHPRWLSVMAHRPGLVSPGALLGYRIEHCDDGGNPEQFYLQRVLPRKITLDLAFLGKRSCRRDIGLVCPTGSMILRRGRAA